jgi:hypothetical protein
MLVTFHGSTGVVTVNLDGVQIINITGQNTAPSGTAQADGIVLAVRGGGGNAQTICEFDNIYVLDNTGAAPLNAILGQPIVETTFSTSDSTTQFTMQANYFGAPYNNSGSVGIGGANKLYLRKFTAPWAGNIASLAVMPAASSATARFKGAIYADNGSGTAPSGSPLKAGTEVTGCTIDTTLTLTLPSVLAITASTIYWIGYVTDESVNMRSSDDTTLGFNATATYTSGVPDPAPTMTSGKESVELWANVTGITTEYTEINFDPENIAQPILQDIDSSLILGDLSYISSSTVNHEDLYGHNALVTNPSTIFTICVKPLAAKSDAGARTYDVRVKSGGAATDSGSNTGISPGQSYTYGWSFWDTDPNTSAAWTKAALDAATKGHKIIT